MENSLRLDHLETEVVALILEYVDDTSPKTTKAVKLTNKFLYSVVQLISNRHKVLKLQLYAHSQNLSTVIDKWAKDDKLLANLRTLTVEGILPSYPDILDNLRDVELWRPLAEFIAKIGRLRILVWNLPSIPPSILDTLHSSQIFAKLRMFDFQPLPEHEPTDIEKAIARSPVLTHLRSVFGRQYLAVYPNMAETALQRIIARAPLEFVSINNRGRAGVFNNDPQFLSFRPRFLTHKKPNSNVRTLTLDGYPISKKMLTEWSTIIDLSLLETVKFSRGIPSIDYFQNAAMTLPSLKHVSLNLRGISGTRDSKELVTAMRDYLYNCPELETLSLWSWLEFLDLESLLTRHGTTLKSLQLHERENYSTSDPRKPLSISQIQLILKSCPKLKDLTMDLNRSNAALTFGQEDRNLECYTMLSAAKLNSLQIYFDCGIAYMVEHPASYAQHNHGTNTNDLSDLDAAEEEESDDDDDDDDVATDDDNNTNNGQPDDGNSSPTGQPAPKRRKQYKSMRPSKESSMKAYVEKIWQTVFKDVQGGPRKLDVKFGEWETSRGESTGYAMLPVEEKRHARHLMTRPAERDDKRGECSILVRKFST